MVYIRTCNEDRRTHCSDVMWTIDTSVHVNVHLNFRSESHVSKTGAATWLRTEGWRRNTSLKSTFSTGIPNGPYSGPVFSKSCPPGSIELMGSNTWEGVYFVFIKLAELGTALVQAPPSTPVVDTPDQVFAEVLAEVDDEATVGTAMPLRPHHNLDRDDLETLPRLQHTSTSAA